MLPEKLLLSFDTTSETSIQKKNFSGHFRHNLTISALMMSGNAAVLHLQYLSTKMVMASCMLNIHKCMIHHFNQNDSADAKMYNTGCV